MVLYTDINPYWMPHCCAVMQNRVWPRETTCDLVLCGQTLFRTEGKSLEHGRRALRNLISHVNPVVTSAMAIAKVRLAISISTHSRFRFLLCSSSRLKTLLAQRTSHVSCSRSTETEILKFSRWSHTSGTMWLNTVLWLVRTPRCRATTAVWPCPRPFPSVRNRVWPRDYMWSCMYKYRSIMLSMTYWSQL